MAAPPRSESSKSTAKNTAAPAGTGQDALDEALARIAAGERAPFYACHGEEFLAHKAAEALAHALVPEKNRALNLLRLDASVGGREIAAQLDTVPMFRGTKVVVVDGAEVLLAKRDLPAEIDRARTLWGQSTRRKDAARRLLSVLSIAGWGAAEMDPEGAAFPPKTRWKKEIGWEPGPDDRGWMHELAVFCLDHEIKAPRDDAELLQQTVTRGPPVGNHLILISTAWDAKHPLGRAIGERGVVIERGVQRSGKGQGVDTIDLAPLVAECLAPTGKRITPEAVDRLRHRLGDAVRLVSSELEKLCLYVGDRPQIEAADVELLVASVRAEEFFELGQAVGDGDLGRALHLIHDDLQRGKHPLPILGSVTAAVRRLAVDAARYQQVPGAFGGRPLSYRDYQDQVFSAYSGLCTGERAPHPYAAFMNWQRVRRAPPRRWFEALATCAEADLALKSGTDAVTALERAVVSICLALRGGV